MFKYFSPQNIKSFNILIKVLHLPYPNRVLYTWTFCLLPRLYQILADGSAGTPGRHDARDDIPVNQMSWHSAGGCGPIWEFFCSSPWTFWPVTNPNLSNLTALWWGEMGPSWGHRAVFTLEYQTLTAHLLSKSEKNKEKLKGKRKSKCLLPKSGLKKSGKWRWSRGQDKRLHPT